MTNSDRGDDLSSELQYAIAAEYDWPDYAPKKIREVARDSASLAAFVGTYTLTFAGQKFPLTVAFEGGKLTYKFAGVPDGEELVAADSAGGFHSAARGWKVDFVGDSVKIGLDSTTVIPGVRAK